MEYWLIIVIVAVLSGTFTFTVITMSILRKRIEHLETVLASIIWDGELRDKYKGGFQENG